jgi:threonine/homoserine/homoserine lactone efflux protein
MPPEVLLALLVFTAVMAFTPGPNNIMLAASGVNFGFERTVPHMLGVTVGFAGLVTSCAAGLGLAFATFPVLQVVLKIAGALYLLWLAYKVATAQPADDDPTTAEPLTFWQALLFQWVNPKGWVAALSGISVYVRPGHEYLDFAIVLAVFTACTAGSVVTWAAFGVALRGLLRKPLHARIFNGTMAVLLVVSIVPMVL